MEQARVIHVTHPDRDLVERCRTRDQAAFREVVARYKNKVYNYIYRMTSDSDDSEDLTQEVFIRMFLSLDSFRHQSSLNTWLFRIASNLCIDRYRRIKRHGAAPLSLDEPLGDGMEVHDGRHEVPDVSYEPHRMLENMELTEQIEKALTLLPEKLRAVILLYDIEGLPYEEISQIVRCPLGTVKSRLFNARMQLRKHLSGYLSN